VVPQRLSRIFTFAVHEGPKVQGKFQSGTHGNIQPQVAVTKTFKEAVASVRGNQTCETG